MKKVKLKGYEKSQNTEDYNKLVEATGGIDSPHYLEEKNPLTIEEELKLAEIESNVIRDISIKRGYTTPREERLCQVGEKIARRRGCI